jgi:hypothetical protein
VGDRLIEIFDQAPPAKAAILMSQYDEAMAPRRPLWLDRSVLAVLIAVGLSLDSRIYRPIWFDEMLQFAFGGFANTSAALAAIKQSLTWINHNQTGAYFLIDFWLLKIFGASPVALRMPSLLSAAFLLLSAVIFCENRRFSLLWKIVLIVGLFAQDSLMSFAAEARPYMPLAAAGIGVFAFYSIPLERRRRRGAMLLGVSAVLLGTLFHPYFPVYWLAILAFFYGLAVIESDTVPGFGSALRFADLRLVALGIVVYFAIAELSWMSAHAPQNLDPMQWVPPGKFWWVFLETNHFLFIYEPYDWVGFDRRRAVPVFMVAVALIALVLPRRWRDRVTPLVPPVVLMALALILSLFLSWVSYRSHYWIMARQWIASFPLVVIAVVWFLREAGRQAAVYSRLPGFALAAVALWSFSTEISTFWPGRIAELYPPKQDGPAVVAAEPPYDGPRPKNEDAWVDLANQNVQAGGPVWGFFRRLYVFD